MNRKILFLFLFLPILGTAQISDKQQQELTALNNYLHFANESTHGLLTAHRLLATQIYLPIFLKTQSIGFMMFLLTLGMSVQ